MLHCGTAAFFFGVSCHNSLFASRADPTQRDFFEPFDVRDREAAGLDDLPDLAPAADLLDEEPFDGFDELPFFEAPPFDDEREPPVFEDGPLDDVLFEEEPLREEPEDLLLLPPVADFPPDERDELDLDEPRERPLDEPEVLREEGLFDADGRPESLPLLRPPPEVPPCAPAANADCTTLAAPSTAPIAAAVAMLPAASAALASSPGLFAFREVRFVEVLFFDFDFVDAICLPLVRNDHTQK